MFTVTKQKFTHGAFFYSKLKETAVKNSPVPTCLQEQVVLHTLSSSVCFVRTRLGFAIDSGKSSIYKENGGKVDLYF